MILFQTWLANLLNSLAAMIGMKVVAVSSELVRDGWRQIPTGRIDFDPAMAVHFGSSDRAIAYALIDYWNRSNERANKRDHFKNDRWWAWGKDKYWVEKHMPWISEATWKRIMGELEAAGLMKKTYLNNEPAYSTVKYKLTETLQIAMHNGQIVDGTIQIDDQPRQFAPSSIPTQAISTPIKPSITTSTAPARDAAVDQPIPTPDKNLGDWKDQPPEGQPVVVDAIREGNDELMHPQPTSVMPSPYPPVPPPPLPRLDEIEADAGGDTQQIRAFLTGCTEDDIQTLKTQHGAGHIKALIDTVRGLPNVRNPPGLVRYMLRVGAPPKFSYPQEATGAKRYITGKYADFIEH